MIKEGPFRKDLFYRIGAFTLARPPLRARRDEIKPLSELFLSKACASWKREVTHIDAFTLNKLENYDWPGNIRQLHNVIENCALLCRGTTITVADLPAFIQESAYAANIPPMPDISTFDNSALTYRQQLENLEIAVTPKRSIGISV